MNEVIISAKNLSIGYGKKNILSDVNVKVRSGDFWFFLGPNGSGKSTLVKSFLRLIKPNSGEVIYADGFRFEKDLGFVPQRCDINSTLPTTVREFVSLGASNMKISRDEIEKNYEYALECTGISNLSKNSYWSLSGGQKQRALIARTLIRKPRALILDEPTNGLDFLSENALVRVIIDLKKTQNMTVIVVTHNINLAARHGSHVAMFSGGGIISGPGKEILNEKNIIKTYGASLKVKI
ncbi:MAG TPA: ATP-binding cassette domain-containing protein [Candidatus Wallbacteria bacterium]|nr:ATP-binding cassette domain-containing protein [Candidatus Wallbacteria bacterium]